MEVGKAIVSIYVVNLPPAQKEYALKFLMLLKERDAILPKKKYVSMEANKDMLQQLKFQAPCFLQADQ